MNRPIFFIMNPRVNLLILLCIAGTVAMPARAQQEESGIDKPLDAAVEDVGPLSTSLRDMQTDLREPGGFENVYKVPGDDDQLMRVSGGLRAVFPRSEYAASRRGAVPLIPAGTVFQIGSSDFQDTFMYPDVSPAEPTGRIDSRVHTRLGLDELADPVATKVHVESLADLPSHVGSTSRLTSFTDNSTTSIVTDSAYRKERIEALLQYAVAACHEDQASEDESPSSS